MAKAVEVDKGNRFPGGTVHCEGNNEVREAFEDVDAKSDEVDCVCKMVASGRTVEGAVETREEEKSIATIDAAFDDEIIAELLRPNSFFFSGGGSFGMTAGLATAFNESAFFFD